MASANQFPKQQFRVVSCSSEEVDYPVQELLTQSPQSKGWQSARFCDYPQEITLQFMAPIHLKQVQFLSHQSKIASKIEIYVYLPDPSQPYQNHDVKYKKLGYLSLDSNERTSYQARELKSVYIDSPCLFLKLLLHKQHVNKYNLFNQVGLIALSCFGESVNLNPKAQLQQKHHYNEIQFETQFDQITLDRLRDLEKAKERAIQHEDYEEAKRIKEAIDRLKQIGIQLRQLDERKIIAVQNEDFDSARVIKAEIDRLRNAVAPEFLIQQQNQFNPEMQNQQFLQQQQQMMQNDPMFQQQQLNQQQQMQQMDPGFQQQMQQQQQMDQYNQQQQQQMQFQQEQDQFQQDQQDYKQQQKQSHHQEEKERYMQDQLQQNRNTHQMNSVSHDSQVIPAMRNQNGMGQEDGGIQGGRGQEDFEAEPLSVAAQKLAEPLIPVLGEEACRQVFSSNWPLKQKGMDNLAVQYTGNSRIDPQDELPIFAALVGACSHTVGDRIAQVSIAAINCFDAACMKYKNLQGPPKQDVAHNIDTVLLTLVEKLGDQKRLAEPSQQAFFSACQCGLINKAHIINILARGSNLSKKIQNSHKHTAARLGMLEQLVQKYGAGNKDVPLDSVTQFAVKSISHQNKDVRENAMNLLALVNSKLNPSDRSSKFRPMLEGIPQQQMDILEEKLGGGSGGGGGAGGKVKPSQKKENVTTNIGKSSPPKSGKATAGGGGAGGYKKPVDQDAISCDFCGLSSPAFADSNKLDIHLWKECPMLKNCPECAQVVEVSELAPHYLEECEHRRKFKQCPRCKEPIRIADYEQHTQEMSCVQAKPVTVANRCTLCHDDIPPGMSGWKQHITIDGCPNNEKTQN